VDRLDAMRLFVRVVEMGSFSAVANQLNVARSVVTRQVAALEAHLGTKLLARSTRRLTLTSAGTLYLEKCRVILNLVDAAETDVAEDRGTPRGAIRLSLPMIYGVKRLAPLLLAFAEQHPEVELSMDFSDRRAKLVEEGIDLSIRITRRLEPNDIVRKLGTCRLLAVAAPDYLLRHGRRKHPADLAGHECLGYRQDTGSQPWTFEADGRMQDFFVPIRLDASNGEVLAGAALRGMGITLQPDFIVASQMADGHLEQVLADFATPELGIYAVLPSNRHVPYRVRRLIEFLAERLGA
jgi:DNA-binding transcriptional LysR family regulator